MKLRKCDFDRIDGLFEVGTGDWRGRRRKDGFEEVDDLGWSVDDLGFRWNLEEGESRRVAAVRA